jgi:N-acetyltransferase
MSDSFLQPRLSGNLISIFPLAPEYYEDLYSAASDPLIWAGHPSRYRYQREEFSQWFDDALASKGALVIADKISGALIGSSRYYEYDQNKFEVAVGFTFLVRSAWGGKINRELKSLLIDHALTRVKTVWFHVNESNIRSQMAMKKLGIVESHRAEKTIGRTAFTYVFFKVDQSIK